MKKTSEKENNNTADLYITLVLKYIAKTFNSFLEIA